MKRCKVVRCLMLIGIVLVGCGQENNVQEGNSSYIEKGNKSVDSIGQVVVGEEMSVRIDFPTIIEKVCVQAGDIIEDGQTLAVINCEEYRKQILLKEKELAIKENEVNQVTSSLQENEQEILSLENELKLKKQRVNNKDSEVIALENKYEIAQNELALKKEEYENWKKIYTETQGISAKEIEAKKIECEKGEKDLNQIKISLKELQENRNLEIEDLETKIQGKKLVLSDAESKNISEINQVKLEEEVASIELQAMKEKLQRASIKDNKLIYSGKKKIVLDVLKNDQEIMGEDKDSTVLMKLGDLENIIVRANVAEELINYVKVGAEVEVKPYANEDVVIKGKVSRISEIATNINDETVVQVDITVKEKDLLKVGYNVDVAIYYS